MTGCFLAREAVAIVALATGGAVADWFAEGGEVCASVGVEGCTTWSRARRAKLRDMRARRPVRGIDLRFDIDTARKV
jgi:hypothetical protein